MIDTAPIRSSVQRSNIPISEICERIGWTPGRTHTNRLRRQLGMQKESNGTYRRRMNNGLAEQIKRAIHDTPYERACEAERAYDMLFGKEDDECPTLRINARRSYGGGSPRPRLVT